MLFRYKTPKQCLFVCEINCQAKEIIHLKIRSSLCSLMCAETFRPPCSLKRHVHVICCELLIDKCIWYRLWLLYQIYHHGIAISFLCYHQTWTYTLFCTAVPYLNITISVCIRSQWEMRFVLCFRRYNEINYCLIISVSHGSHNHIMNIIDVGQKKQHTRILKDNQKQ